MVELYLFAAAVLVLGVLWFHVIAPMLEGFGLLPSVKDEQPAPAEVTSSGREQQYAPVVSDTSIKAVSIPPLAPNATEREIVRWLAGLKTADTWRYSANAIYALVKGNRNDVLAWVRQARGLEDDEPALVQLPEQPHIQVPAYEPPPGRG